MNCESAIPDMSIIPQVVWITGLSGSGKSTVAGKLISLLSDQGHNPVLLDGDELREALGARDDYAPEQRIELALTYARLAKLIMDQGHIVVCSTISLYAPVHEWRRSNIVNLVDVYLKVPLDELERRNSKGVYQGTGSEAKTSIVGKDIKIDEPPDPCLVIENWNGLSSEDAAETVFKALLRK